MAVTHLQVRVCPLAAMQCRLGGGASASFLFASAILPPSVVRLQALLPRVSPRGGNRRSERIEVNLEEDRVEGREFKHVADGQSHQRSAQMQTNYTSPVFGAADAFGGDIDVKPPLFKTCTICHCSKPTVDYEEIISSSDGRSDGCRACLATLKAVRAEKELHHLALSVDEAWALAKPCTKCGLVKELRDFTRSAPSKDQTHQWCRACLAASRACQPRYPPSDQPKRCIKCLAVKAADEFNKHSVRQDGRASVCILCFRKQTTAWTQRRKEAPVYIPRKTKVCTACKTEKPSSEFYVSRWTVDRLLCHCRPCHKLKRKRSGQQ